MHGHNQINPGDLALGCYGHRGHLYKGRTAWYKDAWKCANTSNVQYNVHISGQSVWPDSIVTYKGHNLDRVITCTMYL